MKNIVILNKKQGETPLEALGRFRKKNKQNKKYKDIKMTYAGRLDPMASGLLLILAGEEIKQKEKYLVLGKEYEFEVLFGFITDTYDILGKVVHSNILTNIGMKDLGRNVKKNLKFFTGKFEQTYPIYSSKTVKGKPLFEYARGGEEVEVPTREVNVRSLKFFGIRTIGSKQFLKNIEKRIGLVRGDFRQKEILQIWQRELSATKQQKFFIGSFKIKCSSGTYVRGIANDLGKKISIPALAYSIKRTKIGKWTARIVK